MSRNAADKRAQKLRECATKARHATFAEAERECLRMLKEEGAVLYAYRCAVAAPNDPHYHIGHEPRAHAIYRSPRQDQWTPKHLRVAGMGVPRYRPERAEG